MGQATPPHQLLVLTVYSLQLMFNVLCLNLCLLRAWVVDTVNLGSNIVQDIDIARGLFKLL